MILEKNKQNNSKHPSRDYSSRKNKRKNQDFDVAHFKSIDFFSFLNSQSMMKMTKTKKSMSLNKHHKNSKYAGIHLGGK